MEEAVIHHLVELLDHSRRLLPGNDFVKRNPALSIDIGHQDQWLRSQVEIHRRKDLNARRRHKGDVGDAACLGHPATQHENDANERDQSSRNRGEPDRPEQILQAHHKALEKFAVQLL